MRLFPPAPTMARKALANDEIGGQTIKAGATVIISPWILQRHQLLWDDPDAFKPERFLPENRKAIDRYAYIPFSAGPRVCIGAAFADMEMKVVLRCLLREFTLHPTDAPEERFHSRGVAYAPKRGGRIRSTSMTGPMPSPMGTGLAIAASASSQMRPPGSSV